MTWVVGSAKTIGTSHLASGTVCQDSVETQLVRGGSNFILALSDGAGSSKKSEIGSGLFTKRVCATLNEALSRFNQLTDNELDKIVIKIIAAVRDELVKFGDISDYHATALIAVGSLNQVRIYHIGDGSVLVGEKIGSNKYLLHRSNPENGEFANETFFFTLNSWKEKLRIITVRNPVFCILCSDGVDPFLWDPSSGSRQGFIKPVLKKIIEAGDSSNANKSLQEIIEDPRTDSVTNDDKSIAIAISQDIDASKFEKWLFTDKEKPSQKNYDDINKELENALILQNQQLAAKPTLGSDKTNLDISKTYKKSTLKLTFGVFIFGIFVAVISALFIPDVLVMPPVILDAFNSFKNKFKNVSNIRETKVNESAKKIENEIEINQNNSNGIETSPRSLERIMEQPAKSHTNLEIRNRGVSTKAQTENNDGNKQSGDIKSMPDMTITINPMPKKVADD
ncbi:protein phosphatase 2C domain-containing protein [Polynucleobacter paneuropaeus]|nr:protein phosphatase 2C domain-containing protein [Polynucleobacter paneuropaeus]